jgi:homoserine O-succinyltransferase
MTHRSHLVGDGGRLLGGYPSGASQDTIAIGVINNMCGAGFRTVKQQFCGLLSDAAGDLTIHVRVLSPLATNSAGANGRSMFKQPEDMDELWNGSFDGLIVTGTEPQSLRLTDEPSWPFLAGLVEWSDKNVCSTVWSCLATQAAVYHLDAIERRPLRKKLSGIFDCERCGEHSILHDIPSQWKAPHSRYNDLPEDLLISHGYQTLSRSSVAGADIFIKKCNSLHIFMQGHPEYDGGSLGREYRRDVRRYSTKEVERYPELPWNYFSMELEESLRKLQQKATRGDKVDLLDELSPEILDHVPGVPWRCVAVQFYRNWLTYLSACKAAARGVNKNNARRQGMQTASSPRPAE